MVGIVLAQALQSGSEEALTLADVTQCKQTGRQKKLPRINTHVPIFHSQVVMRSIFWAV